MTQAGPKKLLKTAQNCSKLFNIARNVSKCLTMGQQVSKGVMFLHIQVRKLSLLGIAVAGVYCCMGLRSVSIEPRSCLLLRSEPSIVNFNWQESLVIRLAAIVSINCLSHQHCFDREKTVHTRSFFCFSTASWWYRNQTWTSEIWFFLEIWKVSDLNLTDLHPKLRTARYLHSVPFENSSALNYVFESILHHIYSIRISMC